MKKSKHAFIFALAALFASFGTVQAATKPVTTGYGSSDPSSYIPLAILAVSASVVYFCNRPRVTVRARARARTRRRAE